MVQALPSLVQPLSPSGCLTPPARKYPSHAHDGIHTPDESLSLDDVVKAIVDTYDGRNAPQVEWT